MLVGLANPGKAYADTRHNAGAWFIEEIVKRIHATLKFDTKFHGLYAATMLHDESCHLLIPTTYMNESGQAVRSLMNYRKLSPESILIAHDDIDLPVGTVKLKFDGGDGGHNGLKDIIRHLHTKAFHRLRIGVGRPTHHGDMVDYVLHPPSKADRQKINDALQQVDEVLPLIIAGEMQKAMQQLHTNT